MARRKHLALTHRQHKELERSVHDLMRQQHGGGFPVNTRMFTDVPWASNVRFYVRKGPHGPGYHDDLQQMIGRGIDWAKLQERADDFAAGSQTAAGTLATAGAVAGMTPAAAATPFLEAGALGAEALSLGARGVGFLAELAQD